MDDCQDGSDFLENSFGETNFFGIFSKMTNVSQIFWGGRLTRGKKHGTIDPTNWVIVYLNKGKSAWCRSRSKANV